MKIDITTELELDCLCFKSAKDLSKPKAYKNANEEKITITINKQDAMKFLFRMIDLKFWIGKYVCIISMGSSIGTPDSKYHQYISRILLVDMESNKDNKDNYDTYLVINVDDTIKEILKFYNKAVSIEKLATLLDTEFIDSSKEDLDGVIDEFDLEENKEENEVEDE